MNTQSRAQVVPPGRDIGGARPVDMVFAMQAGSLSRCAALFWSLVVFMPVGMNYLAFFILFALMLVDRGRMTRWQRVRRHSMFWPLAAFAGWTLVVLILQTRYYPQTPSNLWHGVRIIATLALALALERDEALWAMRGFLLSALCAGAVIALAPLVGLPDGVAWHNLVVYQGNKSISNAILIALVTGSAVVVALDVRAWRRFAGLAIALTGLAAVVFVLPNRTSMLILLLAAPVAALHQWRQRRSLPDVVAVSAIVMGAAMALGVPAVRQPLAQGVAEIRQAIAGKVLVSSWNERVQLARYTFDMVLERPMLGWGIGSWNDQWRRRAPAQIADLNMPHDDLLWMGAQAGVIGAASWLALMLGACRVGWRRHDLTGRLAFVAAVAMLFGALVNSATRDAAIGLSLLWVVGLYLRLASEPGFKLALLRPRAAASRYRVLSST